MAKNDTVLLDGIIEQRILDALPSIRRDEVFEFLAFEQVLKNFDLSRDELESGWVDGRDDGGIDGFFILINGHLLRDPEVFTWPKRNVEIEVWILTCKHHDTFQQAPLNSMLASIPELLDLSLERAELRGAYSDEMLKAKALLHLAYRRLSTTHPTLSIHFAYVSRGDSSTVAENIRARANQLTATTQALFSSCTASFEFIGSAELIASYRRIRKFSLSLPVLEYLAREQASYVVLARLEEFYRFVKDESNALRRYLFDSNVRDYLGSNQVNEDILGSLQDPAAPDFWWLNNGVTILATAAISLGKTIQLEDIQIVNGLQTTETIFRYFQSGGSNTSNRALLIKIVVSTDATVRDRIILATNSQSVVELASLRATDKIQRDIEDILERHEWYYERRRNYYRNIGKPPSRFVTPMYIAAGYVSLIKKSPATAARLKSRFMREDESYAEVFSERTPLQAWPIITDVLKRTEDGLALVRPTKPGEGERFFAKWRNLIALLAVSKTLGTFSYGVSDLINFDTTNISSTLVAELWSLIQGTQKVPTKTKDYRSELFIMEVCSAAALTYGIQNPQALDRWKSLEHRKSRAPPKNQIPIPFPTLSEDFLNQVDAALPQQPWQPGLLSLMIFKLGSSKPLVKAAINELIRRGRRHKQHNGVVYNPDGTVLALDPTRSPKL
ncbi:AIPR family protein [Hyalangium sp.]|uniref:AIPR family protein n=1 Tax=Hyalangium sp. TaxID=2028555 RepID=UPI002D496A71|nr:AIPR family protein [Hyalangium sp.]HYI01287.1 AIPR family protein [Hyalangium sp.]